MCAVTGAPAFMGCKKDESSASGAPSASSSASAATVAASSAPSASASDDTTAALAPSTTASVPTPQDFESQAKTTVTTDTLDTQLSAIEKQIEGDNRK